MADKHLLRKPIGIDEQTTRNFAIPWRRLRGAVSRKDKKDLKNEKYI